MGRDLHYVPGSFYRVDDRTGFPTRAGRTRMQWNELIVDEKVWEPRQPQDLVRGVPDYQAVAYPRPLAPAQFVGPLYFEMAATVAVNGSLVYLDSIAGIGLDDMVGIVLDTDSGDIFRTGIFRIGNGFVVLYDGLSGQASSGNLLIDYRPGQGGFIPQVPGATPLLDSDNQPLRDSDGQLLYGSS